MKNTMACDIPLTRPPAAVGLSPEGERLGAALVRIGLGILFAKMGGGIYCELLETPYVEGLDAVFPHFGFVRFVLGDLQHVAVELDVVAVRVFEDEEAVLARAVFGPDRDRW